MAIPNTTKREIRPTHPGEMLREDFMPDYDLNTTSMANSLGVSRQMQTHNSDSPNEKLSGGMVLAVLTSDGLAVHLIDQVQSGLPVQHQPF
jgi:hypothetical protein